jgi:hypothetical protein
MTRAEAYWLAQARNAIERGKTEAEFVVSYSYFYEQAARKAYQKILRETETRQARVANLIQPGELSE